jgi:hypothetical protein
MSVRLCLAVHRLQPKTIAALLEALVLHNAEQYAAGLVTSSPFDLEWRPDQLMECDDDGCRIASTSTLRDAKLLQERGYGSCGELAAAYAAWLQVNGVRAAGSGRTRRGRGDLKLIRTGINTYHVVAVFFGTVYDPQAIGAR